MSDPDYVPVYHSERIYMWLEGEICGPVNANVHPGDTILVRNVEVGELWECTIKTISANQMASIERR